MKKRIVGFGVGLMVGILLNLYVSAEPQKITIEMVAFETSTETLKQFASLDSTKTQSEKSGIISAPGGMMVIGENVKTPSYQNIDAGKLMEALDSLMKEGKVTLIAKPKIDAMEGVKASLYVGEYILYMEKISEDTFRLKKLIGKDGAGIFFEALPTLTKDGKINVSYELIIAKVIGRAPIKGAEGLDIGLPLFSTKESKASIVVEDGNPKVVSGMQYGDATFLIILTAKKM